MYRSILIVGLAAILVSSAVAAPKKHHNSLYKKIGGKKAVAAVVDDFVGRCATDSRISGFFAATAANPQRLKALKKKLEDQLCEATGGGCKYTGKSMKEAHRGMGVRPSDFDALMQNMKASLDKFKVQPKDKKVIVGVLTGMRKDIVVTPERQTASAKPAAKPASKKLNKPSAKSAVKRNAASKKKK